jgi:hypothetical protein
LRCDTSDTPSYTANGVCFKIRFKGINKKPGLFKIKSSDDFPMTGTNVTYASKVVLPYNTNLFYTPIPFDMLRTFEEKP